MKVSWDYSSQKKNSTSDVLILESKVVIYIYIYVFFLLAKFSVAFFTSLGGLATYTHRTVGVDVALDHQKRKCGPTHGHSTWVEFSTTCMSPMFLLDQV